MFYINHFLCNQIIDYNIIVVSKSFHKICPKSLSNLEAFQGLRSLQYIYIFFYLIDILKAVNRFCSTRDMKDSKDKRSSGAPEVNRYLILFYPSIKIKFASCSCQIPLSLSFYTLPTLDV